MELCITHGSIFVFEIGATGLGGLATYADLGGFKWRLEGSVAPLKSFESHGF